MPIMNIRHASSGLVLALAVGSCSSEEQSNAAGGVSGSAATGGAGAIGGAATGGVVSGVGGVIAAGGSGGAAGGAPGGAVSTAGAGGVAGTGGNGQAGSSGGMPASGGASGGSSCAAAGPAPTTIATLTPDLFSDGKNPSGTPECADVLNPERGIYRYRDQRSLGSVDGLRAQGYTLIYGRILIDDYVSRDIDGALLAELDAAFAAVRNAGLKVLPRFQYNDDGGGVDAPLDRVLAHIDQLAPTIRANSDVIAVFQAGFVGAWGEWHSSTNDLTEPTARKAIFDAILAALPADRMTLSRRPSFKQAAYGGPLTDASAFSGDPLSRVGHLNDCFVSGPDDVGTYQIPGERDYAIADSPFVPVGGETCAVYPARSDCAPTLEEMKLLHWTFINTDYHPSVLQGWRSGGCFDTIACRLGYRFALLRHEAPERVRKGETLSMSVRIVNDGYGRLYNPRPVELVLDGPVRRSFAADVDPRRWAPGVPVDVCLSAVVPSDLPPGTYRLGIALPDTAPALRADSRYAVRLSNGVVWNDATGTNLLSASVSVED
jgi:hypothetical protein